MAMIAILKIGWAEYALPPKVDAAKILAALSQGELVQSTYEGDTEVFFPADADRRSSQRLELRYVTQSQIVRANPKHGPRRLNA